MPITKSTKKSISIRIEEAALKKIARAAAKAGMSMNKFFARTMTEAAEIVLCTPPSTLGATAGKQFIEKQNSAPGN